MDTALLTDDLLWKGLNGCEGRRSLGADNAAQ